MTWCGDLDLWLVNEDGGTPAAKDVVSALTVGGWATTDPFGPGISFLPPDAEDEGDWLLAADVSIEEVLAAIDTRERDGRTAGVVLTWSDSAVGGQLLLFGSGHVSLILNVNRIQLENGRTDFSWYVSRIAEALGRSTQRIDRFEASESC